MFAYILDNKEWLFSGAGLAAISLSYTLLFKRKVSVNQEVVHEKKLEVKDIEGLDEAVTKELTEVEQVAKRFQAVLELMNEGAYPQFTISKLAELMNLQKISDLENVFTGKTDPSFSFIEDFCNEFGVYKEWLVEGKVAPFSNDIETQSDPMGYLDFIEKVEPKSIYFVRERSEEAPAFVLLKLSDWKYLILRRTWHISGVVGSGGQRQLYSFYNLIKELRNNRKIPASYHGLTLNKNEFNSLLYGEIFPGKYIGIGFSKNFWWDDLTDIDHNRAISESYESMYGKSFINAQEIIKWYKSEQIVSYK